MNDINYNDDNDCLPKRCLSFIHLWKLLLNGNALAMMANTFICL